MASLQQLWLQQNRFIGSVPPSLASLSSLQQAGPYSAALRAVR